MMAATGNSKNNLHKVINKHVNTKVSKELKLGLDGKWNDKSFQPIQKDFKSKQGEVLVKGIKQSIPNPNQENECTCYAYLENFQPTPFMNCYSKNKPPPNRFDEIIFFNNDIAWRYLPYQKCETEDYTADWDRNWQFLGMKSDPRIFNFKLHLVPLPKLTENELSKALQYQNQSLIRMGLYTRQPKIDRAKFLISNSTRKNNEIVSMGNTKASNTISKTDSHLPVSGLLNSTAVYQGESIISLYQPNEKIDVKELKPLKTTSWIQPISKSNIVTKTIPTDKQNQKNEFISKPQISQPVTVIKKPSQIELDSVADTGKSKSKRYRYKNLQRKKSKDNQMELPNKSTPSIQNSRVKSKTKSIQV